MFKKILVPLILVCCTCLTQAQNDAAIDTYISSNTIISADAIKSKALKSVCTAEFYKVGHTANYSSGRITEYVMVKSNGTFSELSEVSQLIPYVAPGFTLESEADAAQFQKVLLLLFDKGFARNPQFVKTESDWHFIMSDSWGQKEGYIVKTDSNNKITEIQLSDNL